MKKDRSALSRSDPGHARSDQSSEEERKPNKPEINLSLNLGGSNGRLDEKPPERSPRSTTITIKKSTSTTPRGHANLSQSGDFENNFGMLHKFPAH